MGKKMIRSNKGATMVELTMVLVYLLPVLFGISEAGIALYDKAVLTNASREGARAGIVSRPPLERLTDSEIRQVVKTYASTYLITFPAHILGDGDITVTRTGSSFGSDLTVSVNYRYDFLVISRLINMLLSNALGTHITLNATTVMKLE